MRLNKRSSLAILLIFFVGSLQIAAKNSAPIEDFTPGLYSLIKGDLGFCMEGYFNFEYGGSDISLGAYHTFRTETGK